MSDNPTVLTREEIERFCKELRSTHLYVAYPEVGEAVCSAALASLDHGDELADW